MREIADKCADDILTILQIAPGSRWYKSGDRRAISDIIMARFGTAQQTLAVDVLPCGHPLGVIVIDNEPCCGLCGKSARH